MTRTHSIFSPVFNHIHIVISLAWDLLCIPCPVRQAPVHATGNNLVHCPHEVGAFRKDKAARAGSPIR